MCHLIGYISTKSFGFDQSTFSGTNRDVETSSTGSSQGLALWRGSSACSINSMDVVPSAGERILSGTPLRALSTPSIPWDPASAKYRLDRPPPPPYCSSPRAVSPVHFKCLVFTREYGEQDSKVTAPASWDKPCIPLKQGLPHCLASRNVCNPIS